jgi:TolA-binding protein
MSEATEQVADTAAPAVETANITQTAPTEPPNWLPMRLEQAKRSALAEAQKALGVESLEQAKALIEKAKTLEEQRKSDVEKLTERVTSLEPKASRASALEERLGRMADAALAGLTEAQRAAVLAIAKDDKTAALDTIEALRPTWAALAAPAAAPPAPLPAPAKTTAATAAPATTGPSAGTDYRATYEAMKAENPLAAAQFLNLHSRQIFPGQ